MIIFPHGDLDQTTKETEYKQFNNISDLTEYSGGTFTKYYYADGQRIAQRVGSGAPTYTLVDHLGSTRYTLNNSGTKTSEMRYFPWGSTHYSSNPTATPRRQYTGQINDGDTGLYYYNARYYEPGLARFVQADTIVPDPSNPQSYNRYSYTFNNPIKYNDPTGHCPFCIVVGGVIVITKAVDYGWTIYDIATSTQTLGNPDAPRGERLIAGFNIGLAVLMEGAEPDDILPVGLPLDDAARRTLVNGAHAAYKAGGDEGLQIFIRKNLGAQANPLLDSMGLGHGVNISNIKLPTSKHHLNHLDPTSGKWRGWTLESIEGLVANPALTRKGVNEATGNSATAFYRSDGHYVMIDDVTGEIFHVSNIRLKPGEIWYDAITKLPIQPIQ